MYPAEGKKDREGMRMIHLLAGGDIVNNDGTGDTSIYGGTFPDETHVVQFWAPGFLAMYNHGN